MPRAELRGPDIRYHPADRCTYCGAHRHVHGLRVSVEHSTRAPALMCRDITGCLLRMRDRRHEAD